MGFKNILKGIGKVSFPFIAAAASAGGPFTAMAAGEIGSLFGLDVAPTQEGVEKAIADAQVKDPEALLKLKQLDQDFSFKMKQLGFDTVTKLEQIDADDRASARSREIAVKDNTNKILAYMVVLATFTAEGIVMFHGVAAIDGVILGRILGTLDAAMLLVLGYYFGSSSGSAQKTKILESITEDRK